MIIEFGKATTIDNARFYRLNDLEKAEYTRRYTHIPPMYTHYLITMYTYKTCTCIYTYSLTKRVFFLNYKVEHNITSTLNGKL